MQLPDFNRPPLVVLIVWTVLGIAFLLAMVTGQWSLAFISVATFTLSMLPSTFSRRFGVHIPVRFFAWIVIFVFATVFLGEAFDFYTRFWWWDIALHGGSAIGFGLIGFIFVFMLFEGDRYAAPAWAIALISFCFAMTIGVLWEIFEFAMDAGFGLNMQKSGLVDTMGDLIVDAIGATVGALAGFLFLKGRELGGLTAVLHEFIALNRRLFRKRRR